MLLAIVALVVLIFAGLASAAKAAGSTGVEGGPPAVCNLVAGGDIAVRKHELSVRPGSTARVATRFDSGPMDCAADFTVCVWVPKRLGPSQCVARRLEPQTPQRKVFSIPIPANAEPGIHRIRVRLRLIPEEGKVLPVDLESVELRVK